jgi:hypothetical protein
MAWPKRPDDIMPKRRNVTTPKRPDDIMPKRPNDLSAACGRGACGHAEAKPCSGWNDDWPIRLSISRESLRICANVTGEWPCRTGKGIMPYRAP